MDAGFPVWGFDVDRNKIEALRNGRSYIRFFPPGWVQALNDTGRFFPTDDFAALAEVDVVVVCVPTPLNDTYEPDMTYVVGTAHTIAAYLRKGQLIVLESTTYPGTTTELVKPILEAGGLKSGEDFYLAYSPEREDPGNPDHTTATIPKVVGGDGSDALSLACQLYGHAVTRVVPVSSTETAEAVKLTENIFRAVNIALVNELKQVYTAMGIDIWEVIDAAKTKPFGFMAFYPGPGWGGHCIPIDPFYLSWKARQVGVETRFIELAGQINTDMPRLVVDALVSGLQTREGKSLKASRILIVGAAYKKNVDDIRESPALRLMEIIEAAGASVEYYDPYVPVIPATRDHPTLAGQNSIKWEPAALARFEAAVICTDHDAVDYAALVRAVPLIVDTRNATRDISFNRARIVRA